MATNYTTKTAALRATKADINKLDAKKVLLNGKNILDYISDSEFDSYDTRDPQLKNDELDIWNTEISLSEEGHIEVKPLEHTYEEMTDEQKELLLNSATQVIDNEVLDTDGNHLMYWQTDGLTNAYYGVDKDDDGEYDVERSVFFHYDYVDDDALSNFNLTTFNSDLSSLTNGEFMFYRCSNLTTFNSDLSSLTNGDSMFMYCSNLESFDSDLSSLTNGNGMFSYCSQLTSFNSDLSSMTDGSGMFSQCTNFTSFSSDLSSLTNGNGMFSDCPNLTSFNSDLSSLGDGWYMFASCSQLESFTSNLSSLTEGRCMFYDCSKLTSFSSDLSSLTDGGSMFQYCSNLTTFNSDLSSLTNGEGMFNGSKLDATSVANIIHFIPQRDAKPTSQWVNGNITIGIGIANTEEAKQAFAEELDCVDWADLNKEFDDKNWAVVWQFNGEASTFDLRSPRPSTAVFARLEEVIMPTDEKAHKPHYQYTSQDGSKFYNIHWYHDSNTNNEGYDYFESLEEAIAAYGVIAK